MDQNRYGHGPKRLSSLIQMTLVIHFQMAGGMEERRIFLSYYSFDIDTQFSGWKGCVISNEMLRCENEVEQITKFV